MTPRPPIPVPANFVCVADPAQVQEHVSGPLVLCVGTFDGVHRGHQAILARGRALAQEHNCPLWALSFHPHPKTIVRPQGAPLLLTQPEEREMLLGMFGADGVIMMRFDDALARTSAETFATEILRKTIGAAVVVVGADFGFGQGRGGDADFLREWGKRSGVLVEVVDLIGVDRETGQKGISASRVRKHLIDNEFASAHDLLGHPYPVTGRIESGEGRGREIGYPTWNMALADSKLPPPVGIYAAWTMRPEPQPAMVYYGSNPTFGHTRTLLEVHVLGGDRADKTPRTPMDGVWLEEYLRAEVKFASAEELIDQLAADEIETRKVLTSDDRQGEALMNANTKPERRPKAGA